MRISLDQVELHSEELEKTVTQLVNALLDTQQDFDIRLTKEASPYALRCVQDRRRKYRISEYDLGTPKVTGNSAKPQSSLCTGVWVWLEVEAMKATYRPEPTECCVQCKWAEVRRGNISSFICNHNPPPQGLKVMGEVDYYGYCEFFEGADDAS